MINVEHLEAMLGNRGADRSYVRKGFCHGLARTLGTYFSLLSSLVLLEW